MLAKALAVAIGICLVLAIEFAIQGHWWMVVLVVISAILNGIGLATVTPTAHKAGKPYRVEGDRE